MSKVVFNKRSSPPSPPATGKCALTVTSDSKLRLTCENGDSTEFSGQVYGSNYIGAKNVGQDSNGTDSFDTYLGIAYPSGLAITGREYEIGMAATIRHSTGSRNFICRVAIDGTTLDTELRFETKDSGSDIREPIGYKYIVYASELNNSGGFIDFDYMPQDGDDTAYVYSCTITFMRVK